MERDPQKGIAKGDGKRHRMKCLVLSMSQGSRTSLCFRAGSQTLVLHKKDVDLLDQIQRDGKEGWKGRLKEN